MINRENYEIWFIDFIDGKLNQEAIEKLNAFLLLHPDLQEEFQLLSSLPSSFQTNSNSVFEHKKSLKRFESIMSDDENLLLAKDVEGDLDANEKEQLRILLAGNEKLRLHHQAMTRTHLTATFLPFEYKNELLFNESYSGREDDLLILHVLEGNANPTAQAECNARLNSDSNFKERYESYEKIKLIAPKHWCDFRERLYFPEFLDFTQKDMLLAAWAEGDLSGKDKFKAEEFINNDAFTAAEAKKLQQSKLVAPQNILFNHKASLYREAAVVIPLRKYFAYASGLAAIFVLMFWVLSRDRENLDQFAAQNDEKKQNNQPEVVSNPKIPENNTASQSTDPGHVGDNQEKALKPILQDPQQDVAQGAEQPIQEQQNSRIVQENISILNKEMAQNNENNTNQNNHISNEFGVIPNQVSIANNTPDMGLVYQETLSNKKSVQQDGTSLLSLVGKAAGERLGKTHAYALAERQISKWTASTEENIEKEFLNDHMHLRLGNFSIDRKKEEKPERKERGGILGLIQRTYRKIENNKK